MAVSKNPKWTKDELILLLDLYFDLDLSDFSEKNSKIIELSELLGRLPVHAPEIRNIKFRNPAGIHMKLRNLGRFDASYPGGGLQRGGVLEEEIWKEFSKNRQKLRATAQAIRENSAYFNDPDFRTSQEFLDEGFPEGKILSKIHNLRERNPKIVAIKKKRVLKETGRLECEVCNFDFAKNYGDLGFGYAECHHTLPLANLPPGSSTKLSDLAIVCANCHRMLHRSKYWISMTELKNVVNPRSTSG